MLYEQTTLNTDQSIPAKYITRPVILSATQVAWTNISDVYSAALVGLDVSDSWYKQSPSIFDAIQAEYRQGRITEAQRDQMRQHVREWLGDPDKVDELLVEYRSVDDYARYACGVWAGSTGPMGRDEHAIILMTITILTEEAA